MFEMVREFHKAFGQPAPDSAEELSEERQDLRLDLIEEEYNEYIEAVGEGDLVEIAKELADLMYVVLGTAVEHGLVNFDEIFAAVHASNMTKLGADGKPIRREDGKVVKGPNYKEPDLTSLVK